MNHLVLEIMDEMDKRSGDDDLGGTLLVVMGDHGQVPCSSSRAVCVVFSCFFSCLLAFVAFMLVTSRGGS